MNQVSGEVTAVAIATSPGTNPDTLKTTLTFSAVGNVDIYASDDLVTWGSPLATDVASSPFEEDNLTSGRRFYLVLLTGSPAP
ncbi:hypothetical protein [Haloferula rosea]|uniref:Uncharacterized protein n=1 Tax=Haloferula rosea TaxID=490093 RepID=A0A934RGJ8_9BACT|nr:hypothetical protein [Haloferula rosea]MBK1829062.1 hypothetical protein [Haloferula rosea]